MSFGHERRPHFITSRRLLRRLRLRSSYGHFGITCHDASGCLIYRSGIGISQQYRLSIFPWSVAFISAIGRRGVFRRQTGFAAALGFARAVESGLMTAGRVSVCAHE